MPDIESRDAATELLRSASNYLVNTEGDYPDVMIDLETLGKRSDSAFVEIGMVRFDRNTGDYGLCLQVAVDIQSCIDHGLVVDGSTIRWWMQQSDEARAAFEANQSKAMPLPKALEVMTRFLQEVKGTRVWGNGSRFDLGLPAVAYERLKLPIPWAFYREFDVRTIVDLGRDIGFDPKRDMPFEGVAHTTLADCFHQIKYITAIRNRLLRRV